MFLPRINNCKSKNKRKVVLHVDKTEGEKLSRQQKNCEMIYFNFSEGMRDNNTKVVH